MTQKFMKQYS